MLDIQIRDLATDLILTSKSCEEKNLGVYILVARQLQKNMSDWADYTYILIKDSNLELRNANKPF